MRKITLTCLTAVALTLPPAMFAQQQTSPQNSPTPTNPTHNNPDVPHQAPGTDNPDVAPQNQPAPGGTGTPTKKSSKRKNRKNSTTTSTTSTQS